MRKEPKLLRIVNPSIKSVEIKLGGKSYVFDSRKQIHAIDAEDDVSHLNRRDFVVGEVDDKTLINWYRSLPEVTTTEVIKEVVKEVPIEITEESAVEFLKARGYLAYKRKEK